LAFWAVVNAGFRSVALAFFLGEGTNLTVRHDPCIDGERAEVGSLEIRFSIGISSHVGGRSDAESFAFIFHRCYQIEFFIESMGKTMH
jgi:hypothetical protein